MSLDYTTLDSLRRNHPAWRFLLADHAPFVASFLQRVFVEPNVRGMAQSDLAAKLEDQLYTMREAFGADAFPKNAEDYLDDWAQDSRGWLRKFYPRDSDEPHFDLTPSMERVLDWLSSLVRPSFIGTESRLQTVFILLRQLVENTEPDPEARIRELKKRRKEIDEEIGRIKRGHLTTLDESAVRDRFQQITAVARDILSDFREVEQNFRNLDRTTRERIATWEGSKGALLGSILGERDAISDSDQGKSFKSFWTFLMSAERQEELSELLDAAFGMSAVITMRPDARLRRIHHQWLEAGERTQQTVALLSQQLRRFVDDQTWLDNRRIMDILRNLEKHAATVKDSFPEGNFMEIDDFHPDIELPFERPLYSPPLESDLSTAIVDEDTGNPISIDALYNQVVVDKEALMDHIRHTLFERDKASLGDVVARFPLEHGLAELVTYLAVAAQDRNAVFDDDSVESLEWLGDDGVERRAVVPRVIFNAEVVQRGQS